LGTYHDCIMLWWDQCQYKWTVPLDPDETNIGTITTAPGYTQYHDFAAKMDEPEGGGYDEDLTYEPRVISDDKDDGWTDKNEMEVDKNEDRQDPVTAKFDLNGPRQSRDTEDVDANEEDCMPQDTSAEFLRWHHQLGHLSPKKIKILSKIGVLPKRLAGC